MPISLGTSTRVISLPISLAAPAALPPSYGLAATGADAPPASHASEDRRPDHDQHRYRQNAEQFDVGEMKAWAGTTPDTILISVDLPAPFSPSSAWTSPCVTENDTS
jgi:hypothetical protein